MPYIGTIKGKYNKQVTVQIFKSKESYTKVKNLKTRKYGERISKADAKGYIRDYVQSHRADFKNKIIHVAYFADEGPVNIDNVRTDGDLTNADIEKLMVDPKTNKHEKPKPKQQACF